MGEYYTQINLILSTGFTTTIIYLRVYKGLNEKMG